MICPDREDALNALIDGELDPAAARALEAHLATCPGCASGLAALLGLRAELRALAPPEPVPASLRDRIDAALPAVTEPVARPRPTGRGWPGRHGWGLGLGLAGLAAAGLLLFVFLSRPRHDEGPTLAALADAAARIDLPSPAPGLAPEALAAWFRRQDLPAPPVPQLAASGFRFAGYGSDLVGGHRAARIGYRAAEGSVTLFAWPPGRGEPAHPPREARAGGWSVIYWNDGRTEFWAVGARAATVRAFVAAYRAAA